MKQFNKTLIATAIMLSSTQAMAAGFQLNSQSATGIGRAMAGDAIIADNASVLARNPAAMAMFDKKSLSMGLTYADIDVNVDDVSKTIPGMGTVNFGSVDGAADSKFIPNLYYINPIDDKFAVGFAVFSNYGTGTDLTPLANSGVALPGTYLPAPVDLLGNTEVTTINFNTSMSYRVNDEFSFGFGLDAIYAQGTLTRTGNLPVPNVGLVPVTLVDVDADGWALGAIFGMSYEVNADHRFGLSYRVSPTLSAKGDINYNFQEYAKIDIPMADIAQFAGFHQLTETFAVHYTAQWTSWSDFDHITVKNDPAQQHLKTYHWQDSWFLSLGATYNISKSLTARVGVASDEGVVNQISSLSIPDSDRHWFTTGLSYQLNTHSSVDVGVAYVQGEDVTVYENSALIGEISATTRSNGAYYSVQYNYSF
jgi:long-chain fatty acid transport protein